MSNELIMQLLNDIHDSQKETSVGVTKLDKKLSLHIQKTELELKQINKLDVQQNQLLEKHAARSEELQRQNDLIESNLRMEILGENHPNPEKSLAGRVSSLEEPKKWLNMTKKIILWLGGISGALVTMWKIYDMWGNSGL